MSQLETPLGNVRYFITVILLAITFSPKLWSFILFYINSLHNIIFFDFAKINLTQLNSLNKLNAYSSKNKNS